MKQLSSVSIKCPCIDQVLVYQSSTQMFIDQVLTCIDQVLPNTSKKQLSSELIKYSCINQVLTFMNQVLKCV